MAAVKYAAVSLVERDDRRILCVWNRRYGGWAMPGGMVEPGETAEDTQRRELREEAGVETVMAERVFEGEHGIRAAEDHDRARRIVLFRVTIQGEPREMESGCPVAWKTREEFLSESPFAPIYKRVFADMGDSAPWRQPHADLRVCQEAPIAISECIHCDCLTLNAKSDTCACGNELYPVSKNVPAGTRIRGSLLETP